MERFSDLVYQLGREETFRFHHLIQHVTRKLPNLIWAHFVQHPDDLAEIIVSFLVFPYLFRCFIQRFQILTDHKLDARFVAQRLQQNIMA